MFEGAGTTDTLVVLMIIVIIAGFVTVWSGREKKDQRAREIEKLREDIEVLKDEVRRRSRAGFNDDEDELLEEEVLLYYDEEEEDLLDEDNHT